MWKYVFIRGVIKIKGFSLVLHSCRSCSTRVARVSLVSHLCHSCRISVARVALVSLVSGTLQLYWNCTSARYAPVNLLHIFRTPFPRNTSGWLLLIPVQILKENVNFSRYISIFYNNVITTSKFPFFLNEWPMQLLFSNAQCNSYFLEVKTKRKILDQSAFY